MVVLGFSQFAVLASRDGKTFHPVTTAMTTTVATTKGDMNTKDSKQKQVKGEAEQSRAILETTDGCTRVVLAPVVRHARFVRVLPKKVVKHGCMRVELYGY
mmetsp:Transcript_34711/g.64259  ORF Transcript_34711/g.64259 Transcript_34711/m.64259 type:complete len:101 (-) Transcript_34711:130-432(-)